MTDCEHMLCCQIQTRESVEMGPDGDADKAETSIEAFDIDDRSTWLVSKLQQGVRLALKMVTYIEMGIMVVVVDLHVVFWKVSQVVSLLHGQLPITARARGLEQSHSHAASAGCRQIPCR